MRHGRAIARQNLSPCGPARKGLITLGALVAAVVLIIAVMNAMLFPSDAPPGTQPSAHAIDQSD